MSYDVIVLAGGSTVAEYDLRNLHNRGVLIAVNDAALYTHPFMTVSICQTWVTSRYPLVKTLGIPQVMIPKLYMGLLDVDHKTAAISKEHLRINNSGAVALSLALETTPHRVFLLGFDMKNRLPPVNAYWYPDYPWRRLQGSADASYAQWVKDIGKMPKTSTTIYNVTHDSALDMFEKITYKQFQDMTSDNFPP